jgi:hypothetical protein
LNLLSWFRELSRLGKTAVVLLILFVLYVAVAGLGLPTVAKSRVENLLTEQLKRETRIEKIRINPFFLALSVDNFEVAGTDGEPFVAFRGLHLNVDPLASIVNLAVTLKYLRLVDPSVRIRIDSDGQPNFADLMEDEEPETQEPEEEGSGELFPIVIGRTTVENGRVEFHDESRPEPFQVEISPIAFDLSRFGTRLEESTPYDFVLRITEGAELHWKGTVSMAPLSSQGSLALESVRLPRWKYLSESLKFQILAGSLSANADYSFDGSGDEPALTVSNGELTTENIEIGSKRRTEKEIAVPSLTVSGVTYDLATNALTVANAESRDGHLAVRLADDGNVNLQQLFTPVERGSAEGDEPDKQPAPATDDEAGTPFQLTVESVRLSNYTVDFEDQTGPVQASVAASSIEIGVKNFSLSPNAKSAYTVGLNIQETGRIDVDGTFGIEPFFVDSHVKAANLPLQEFDPYVSRGANLSVRSGTADAELDVAISAANTVSVENGSLEVRDLSTSLSGADLLDWRSLAVDGFELDLGENSMGIELVQLTEPSVAVLIDTQGRLNFSELTTDPVVSEGAEEIEEALEEAEAEGDPFGFQIGAIRITDGAVSIADESVDPPFSMNVTNLQATVKNLSSETDALWDISLAGDIDETGELKIAGEVTPLAASKNGELDFMISGINAVPFSPYLESGIGYRIKKGQISVKAPYTLEDNVAESVVKIRAEELDVSQVFGIDPRKLLPLGLAVDALKDMHGTINVDVPVKEDYDNPNYKFGKPLRDALQQMIIGAAASPFSIAGKLAGFLGDDLGTIEFEPGDSEVDSLQAQKLDALSSALLKKESLVLIVVGAANPEIDGTGLAKRRVERRLKQVRFEELKGRGPENAEDIALTNRERERILEDLYEDQFGESARSLEKRLRKEGEIEKDDDEDAVVEKAMVRRLAESDPPTGEDLKALADARATHMAERVAATDGIDDSRIRVVEPDLDAKESGGRVRAELDLTTH